MKREEPATGKKSATATIVKFVSRVEQLRLRGMRNYNRYMLFNKGFVAADGPERRQWEKESAEESVRDAAWSRRHGPVPGGAAILRWRHESERPEEHHPIAHGERSRSHADGG